MACFTAAVAEAIVVHGIRKTIENKHPTLAGKLQKLVTLLLSGSFLLMIEHIWHGEITFYYPFLTAMNSPEDTLEMFYEILSVGGCIDIAVTSVWFVIYCLSDLLKKGNIAKEA